MDLSWTGLYYFHSSRGQNRKPQTQMDIRLSCSLHFFVSSLFSHLPAQTVNVWPQCIFDPVPSSTGLEGHRQSQSVEATFPCPIAIFRRPKMPNQWVHSQSNKKYPTEFVLLTEKKHSLANEWRFRKPTFILVKFIWKGCSNSQAGSFSFNADGWCTNSRMLGYA